MNLSTKNFDPKSNFQKIYKCKDWSKISERTLLHCDNLLSHQGQTNNAKCFPFFSHADVWSDWDFEPNQCSLTEVVSEEQKQYVYGKQ